MIKIGIECKGCSHQWRLELPKPKHLIADFACLCECGEIIVGNYRRDVPLNDIEDIPNKFLTNGSFKIISIGDSVNSLNLLELE